MVSCKPMNRPTGVGLISNAEIVTLLKQKAKRRTILRLLHLTFFSVFKEKKALTKFERTVPTDGHRSSEQTLPKPAQIKHLMTIFSLRTKIHIRTIHFTCNGCPTAQFLLLVNS